MQEPMTKDQGERIIALLQMIAGVGTTTQQAPGDKPVHSGHKGGEFLKEVKLEFDARFAESGLEWKMVQGWITTVFKISSTAVKKVPGAKADDLEWLYSVLHTSLANGFAHVLQDKD